MDGEFRWSQEMTPKGEGTSVVDSAEDGAKTFFEHLDSPFSDVAMVAVRGE
jgi:hypothetical protein